MERQKLQYCIMVMFGGVILGGSFALEYVNQNITFYTFLMVIFTLGSSTAIKIILNQYTSHKQYHLLNPFVISSIFKSILLIGQCYYQLRGYQEVNLMSIVLQSNLLDIAGVVTAFYFAKREVPGEANTYIMAFAALAIWVLNRNISSDKMTELINIIGLFNFIVILGVRIKNKHFIEELLNEKLPFFQMFMDVLIIQQLFYLGTVSNGLYYEVFMVAAGFLQVFYLAHCILYVCLSEPWEQKVRAINKADETIIRQNKNCDTIVSLSHELKTPVNVIRSALDILSLDIEGQTKEDLKEIKVKCNELMNLIQDMIDIQKINTNHIEVNLKSYNLVELLENVIDAFSKEVKGVQCIFNPQEEELDQMVDGLLMQQCFMLLIGMLNSREADDESYIEMGRDLKHNKIYIKCISSQVAYLRQISKELKEIQQDEEITHIEDLLTLKLIQIILSLHQADLEFKEDRGLYITFTAESYGKRAWLDERNIAVLNDQIRCRYIDS